MSAPSPDTRLEGLSLSRNWNSDYSQSSNIVPYPTLASAVRAAHSHNFSGTLDNARGVRLKYGTFYLIEYFGEITTTYNETSPPKIW